MKCFLHIGTEKTATTTIQKFFHLNRKYLRTKGCLYSQSTGKINNRAFPVAAYELARRDDFTRRHKIQTNEALQELQQNIIKRVKDEIGSARNEPDFIIFSSEHFQSRLTKVSEIQRLKDILYGLGITDISVIVYLRSPADLASSLYSTSVRAGAIIESPPLPSDPYWNNVCNHKRTIENFGYVFGEQAVIPKLFQKSEFPNESIILDILNVVGLAVNQKLRMPNNQNEGLSIKAIKVLRGVNRTLPAYLFNRPNFIREFIARCIPLFLRGPKYVMSESLREKYDVEFSESNEWVRKKYFPARENLF